MTNPVRITEENLPQSLIKKLPYQGLVWVSSCSAESSVLQDAVIRAGKKLGEITFTGIFVPGFNQGNYLANEGCKIRTYFVTPSLQPNDKQVEFLPSSYTDILTHYRKNPPDAALVMLSPPDENGLCSLGSECHFLGDLWPKIPNIIAHINPKMPKTRGSKVIPFSAISAYIEQEQPLLTSPRLQPDTVSMQIADHIKPLVPNGATLQLGLGKIPGSILSSLTDHKNLNLHSGLVGSEILDLIEAGVLAGKASACIGVAIGIDELYSALSHPVFDFQPVSITHNTEIIASKAPFIAINSAMSVDLFGQVYSEATHKGLMSGPGGASDFARGVQLAQRRGCEQSLRIIALPSTAGKTGKISKIVGPDGGSGPVSLGRMDTDLIVTEYGIADLRWCSPAVKANRLIAIAAPEHRRGLTLAWNNSVAAS